MTAASHSLRTAIFAQNQEEHEAERPDQARDGQAEAQPIASRALAA